MVGFPEFFQIDTPVAFYGDQIVGSFLIIPDKKIFSVCFRIGQRDSGKFRHVVNGLVFRDFVPDMVLV